MKTTAHTDVYLFHNQVLVHPRVHPSREYPLHLTVNIGTERFGEFSYGNFASLRVDGFRAVVVLDKEEKEELVGDGVFTLTFVRYLAPTLVCYL